MYLVLFFRKFNVPYEIEELIFRYTCDFRLNLICGHLINLKLYQNKMSLRFFHNREEYSLDRKMLKECTKRDIGCSKLFSNHPSYEKLVFQYHSKSNMDFIINKQDRMISQRYLSTSNCLYIYRMIKYGYIENIHNDIFRLMSRVDVTDLLNKLIRNGDYLLYRVLFDKVTSSSRGDVSPVRRKHQYPQYITRDILDIITSFCKKGYTKSLVFFINDGFLDGLGLNKFTITPLQFNELRSIVYNSKFNNNKKKRLHRLLNKIIVVQELSGGIFAKRIDRK
jgi:hypothetical protein